MKIQALQTDMFEDLNKIFKDPFPRLIHLNGKDILFRNEVEQVELANRNMSIMFRLPNHNLDLRRDLYIAMCRNSWPNKLDEACKLTLRELIRSTISSSEKT